MLPDPTAVEAPRPTATKPARVAPARVAVPAGLPTAEPAVQLARLQGQLVRRWLGSPASDEDAAGVRPGPGRGREPAAGVDDDTLNRLRATAGPDDAGVAVTPARLRSFVALVLQGNEAAMRTAVEQLREEGVSVSRIYLDLLAPAARTMGVLWDQDVCDFPGVTVGLGRLQRLLRELSPDFDAEVPDALASHLGPRVLLAQPPREQHSFGLAIVAAFLRRAGYLVEGGSGATGVDPLARAQTEFFDVVGLSVGSLGQLAWLRERVATLRQVSRNASLVVLVGGPLLITSPGALAQVGADACVADARDVPAVAARLIAERLSASRGHATCGAS